MKTLVNRVLPVALAFLFIAGSSFATDGYFLTGYGTKQQGQGGAGVAKPADSLAGATNPAGLILVGNRFDIGLTLFRPHRSATITGSPVPNEDVTFDGNRVKNFELPELGYSLQYRPNLALGVAIYGNGGLNTSYTQPIPLFGSTRGGVNIEQVFISPTLAYKLGAHNSLGIAANIAIQLFADEGLQNFANPASGASSDPTKVSNNGSSYGKGGGVRVGWLGELNRAVSVGATYQSRTYVSKFDRYRGLFAERGGFDVPANFAGGAAVKLGSKATVLYDEERILFGQVKSIANPLARNFQLGTDNGPGFGWHDINVAKTGLDYDVNPALTLRGGYNHGGAPFDGSQAFFNILAPAVTKDHLHAGVTVSLKDGKEISFAYIHAFGNTVNGPNAIPAAYGGGNVSLSMYQNSFQIAFGWNHDKKK